MEIYRKSRHNAPRDFFAAESLGLQWLDEEVNSNATAVRIAQVVDYGRDYLNVERIQTCTPTEDAAFLFGANLAQLHLKGAPHYGYSPSPKAYFGPLSDPVPAVNDQYGNFKDYFINGRMQEIVEIGIKRGEFSTSDLKQTLEVVKHYLERASDEAWIHEPPARVHGDLWSGNLLWTHTINHSCEAVLIDPSAHGGHFEEDLAMLQLFGCPYYAKILEGYKTVRSLDGDFRSRFVLHNLYPIAGHVVFFGGGYYHQYMNMLHSLSA